MKNMFLIGIDFVYMMFKELETCLGTKNQVLTSGIRATYDQFMYDSRNFIV